ncbi:MAG: STAS domain-containing protein [Comamonas sp.]|nr:STAS domain-containing protein [Comamonas sp.]
MTTRIALPPQLDTGCATAQLARLCQALDALPAGSACVLDAAQVQQFDSAGLAVLLACRRHALASGKTVHVAQWPDKLHALAQVYGVAEWLAPEAPTLAQSA